MVLGIQNNEPSMIEDRPLLEVSFYGAYSPINCHEIAFSTLTYNYWREHGWEGVQFQESA